MKRLVGNPAPQFTMQALAADGENFVPVSLEGYRGSWLVMFFYPLDFTFVCPTELTAFAERLEEFHGMQAQVLAVSTDSVYSHLAWQKNGLGKLGYAMGADQTLQVARDYGVLLEDEGIALRGLFIIDPDSNVRYSTIHDNNIGRNPDEVLRVLAALQTGGLCAAGWSAGDDNLNPAAAAEEAPQTIETDAAVKVYSMPKCSYCRSVKEYLQSVGVAFQEVDLATDKVGQAFMADRGYTKLPVTVIGSTEISGYDMPQIKAALQSL